MPALRITQCESPLSGGLRGSMVTLVNRPDKVTQASAQGLTPRRSDGSQRAGLAPLTPLNRAISPRAGRRPFADRAGRLPLTEGRAAALARQPAPGQGADEWEQF